MLFSFAAFSIARAATCSDFNILANGKSQGALGMPSVRYEINIGEDLEFTVSPVGDVKPSWSLSLPSLEIITTEGPSYSPPISVGATGNITQEMILKVKNCGVEKTIVIKLKEVPYKVIFDPNEGSSVPSQDIMPGKSATEPSPYPIKIGHEFDRWEMPAGTAYDFSALVTDNITLVAAWIPETYIIELDPQNGEAKSQQSVTYNEPVGDLPTPTKSGYEFVGWYLNGRTEYTSTTIYRVDASITLSAKWEPIKYTITFDVDVDCEDVTVNPESKRVAYNERVGTLPIPTRAAHGFMGWYSIYEVKYTETTVYEFEEDITLYAKWEFIKGTRPVVGLLDFTIPTNLVYGGAPISALPTASQKTGNCGIGQLGEITILYDGKDTPPKDAGTYAIAAFIAKDVSGDYDTATVSLGPMTIAKAPATASVLSATVKPKIYDADSLAEIDDVNFSISPLYAGDEVSIGDYVISAYFSSPDVGTQIVNGTIGWRLNGPLSKNYIIGPSPLSFTTTAIITQATGELRIIANQPYDINKQPFYKYTYAEGYANPTVDKNSFIPDSVIKFEYKKEGENDDAYTTMRPNRLGRWFVKATLPGTANYTGDMDSILFIVERGDAKPVKHEIEIPIALEDHFTEDLDLSGKLRRYYVGNVCDSERQDSIKITITEEPDIILKLNISSDRRGDESMGYYYYVPFNFGKTGFSKPGLDTLIYTLVSTDNLYKEYDTLLIETPIAFDSIAKQKWNNVLLINNNPRDNGGYEFKDFKWFKNDKAIDSLQFYSAGPKSTDVLKSSDTYKVTMHTGNGIRISTCEGNPKRIAIIPAIAAEKPAVAKQVLGINGKNAKPEQKVYDASGAQRKNTPVGVYIIKDK